MQRSPREAALAALTGAEPAGWVPTFELEFQLTDAIFGKPWYSIGRDDDDPPSRVAQLADDFIEMYTALDYSILFETRCRDDETRIELIRRVREASDDRFLCLCHGDATWAIPNGQQFVDFSVRMFEDPDGMKRDAEAMVDRALERGRRLLDGGLDGFVLCADYCFNSGPFLSPPQFREHITPFLHRLVSGYRELGAIVIKHTDGNIMPVLDDLISGGPHGLHSLDPQGGVDIAEVKRLIGDRVCLLGGVNCGLLQTGTEAECREQIEYTLRHGMPGGRYVFCTSNVAFRGMPPERYLMMLEMRRELGRYPGASEAEKPPPLPEPVALQ